MRLYILIVRTSGNINESRVRAAPIPHARQVGYRICLAWRWKTLSSAWSPASHDLPPLLQLNYSPKLLFRFYITCLENKSLVDELETSGGDCNNGGTEAKAESLLFMTFSREILQDPRQNREDVHGREKLPKDSSLKSAGPIKNASTYRSSTYFDPLLRRRFFFFFRRCLPIPMYIFWSRGPQTGSLLGRDTYCGGIYRVDCFDSLGPRNEVIYSIS